MEVRVRPVDLDRLVPQDRLHAGLRLPVELHVRRLAGRVHEAVAVDAEPLHEAERALDQPLQLLAQPSMPSRSRIGGR